MDCDFSLYRVLGRYLSDGAHAVDRQVKVAYLSIVDIPPTLRHSIACRPKRLPCFRSTFALLSARCALGTCAPHDLRVVVPHRVRLVAPALQPAGARPGLSLPVLRSCAPSTRERRRSSGNRPPAQHFYPGSDIYPVSSAIYLEGELRTLCACFNLLILVGWRARQFTSPVTW